MFRALLVGMTLSILLSAPAWSEDGSTILVFVYDVDAVQPVQGAVVYAEWEGQPTPQKHTDSMGEVVIGPLDNARVGALLLVHVERAGYAKRSRNMPIGGRIEFPLWPEEPTRPLSSFATVTVRDRDDESPVSGANMSIRVIDQPTIVHGGVVENGIFQEKLAPEFAWKRVELRIERPDYTSYCDTLEMREGLIRSVFLSTKGSGNRTDRITLAGNVFDAESGSTLTGVTLSWFPLASNPDTDAKPRHVNVTYSERGLFRDEIALPSENAGFVSYIASKRHYSAVKDRAAIIDNAAVASITMHETNWYGFRKRSWKYFVASTITVTALAVYTGRDLSQRETEYRSSEFSNPRDYDWLWDRVEGARRTHNISLAVTTICGVLSLVTLPWY